MKTLLSLALLFSLSSAFAGSCTDQCAEQASLCKSQVKLNFESLNDQVKFSGIRGAQLRDVKAQIKGLKKQQLETCKEQKRQCKMYCGFLRLEP